MKKVIRTICYFDNFFSNDIEKRLSQLKDTLLRNNFEIQTTRICIDKIGFKELESQVQDKSCLLSSGTLTLAEAVNRFDEFRTVVNSNFNIELSKEEITKDHADFLLKIIRECPTKTFNFTYVFNNIPNSPYFPSASYKKAGFSIGLQPTDLAEDCSNLEEWFQKMKLVWDEIDELFKNNPEYLGIDTSIAPLLEGYQSFIYLVKKLYGDFSRTFTTDLYTRITKFIKTECNKPIGLCGLMMPCLEDAQLALEYEKNNFSIERNIFVSLHSGLGIDTYPIGIDEKPERILEIFKLVQALSNKYKKALSIRFVSDGSARIGERSNFRNQYLQDVVIRKL